MDDATKFYLQITAATFCGGLGGQVLRSAIEWWQGRTPAIRYTVERDFIFSSTGENSPLKANVTVEHGNVGKVFSNITLIKAVISNRTRNHFPTFTFGARLDGSHKILAFDKEAKDEYHNLTAQSLPTPIDATDRLDVTCEPLNRNDSYTLKLYVTSEGELPTLDSLRLVTGLPVKLERTKYTYEYGPWGALAFVTSIVALLSSAGLLTIGVLSLILPLPEQMISPIGDQKARPDQSAEFDEIKSLLKELKEQSKQRNESLDFEEIEPSRIGPPAVPY